MPSAAGFDEDYEEVAPAQGMGSAVPPCPPTPSRTPGYSRRGKLVRQNSLGDNKLLIAAQSDGPAASGGPDTEAARLSMHDKFEGWSTIGQGSFSIAFQVSHFVVNIVRTFLHGCAHLGG
jgi:hypothetical protein